VADGWCWFVLREEYCWLVAGGWFVVREKYCWLVADKPSEQGSSLTLTLKWSQPQAITCRTSCCTLSVTLKLGCFCLQTKDQREMKKTIIFMAS
jgi:hypothetical protein